MNDNAHDPGGAVLTALILETFRFNGALLQAGDRLVGDLGLTSARWQVLGAIALADPPEPVARLARGMGLARQGVQRIVNELAAESLVAFRPNPHHRRAQLVVLTAAGEAVYAAALARQAPWANALARGLPPGEIDAARALLQRLRARLEERREEP
ncbi:MarR family winged helix-turn-helix transcriptional regulator [Minwuia thermotolerans]|uniref:MarR family transcriptional regulator n=1 Tax=Minwuia thermotolerans TaxID=2056226 RepID=A0A2M9G500_9PROT|nr:helix-turn-helix domain-containing protein [Minwuia thermotolerans]PJK30797.1 MarR family transcriptional regulator [Minwuia thermotolerans]